MRNNKQNNQILLQKRGFKFYLIIVFCVLQCFCSVLFALFIKFLVNAVEYSKGNNIITVYSVLLAVFAVLSFAFGFLQKIMQVKLVTKTEIKLKKQVLKKYINGSYDNVLSVSSGDLVSRIENDCLKVANVHISFLPTLISTVTHVVLVVVALLALQPNFTLIVLACLSLVVASTYFIRKRASKLYKTTRIAESKTLAYIGEVNINAFFIKSTGCEDAVISTLNGNLKGVNKAKLKQRFFGSTVTSLTSFAFTAFYAFAIIWGIAFINYDGASFSYGTLIAILQLAYQIKSPMTALTGFVPAKSEKEVALSRLQELINNTQKQVEVDAINYQFISAKFVDVCFNYGDKKVLENVNLQINYKDGVLIKGQSGIGKTTFLKLLTGVNLPTSGKIIIELKNSDGKVVQTSPEKCKNLFAVVPQGNMLFTGSVYENATTLNKNATLTEVEGVLKEDCYRGIIKETVDDYVGINGSFLSEGQAQRLAIARAIIAKYKILVLDEATSSLDEKTEQSFIQMLKNQQDLTIVAVSHKQKLASVLKNHYFIDNNKIVKQ